MQLYRVYEVIGDDRNNPEVDESLVVAENTEQAKLKAGFIPAVGQDLDYYTIIVQPVGAVALKEKPAEVKNI